MTGIIKSFNARRGYGFIGRDGFDDLFVHITQVRGAGPRDLQVGDQVSFDIGREKNGPRPCAVNVIVQLRTSDLGLRTQ